MDDIPPDVWMREMEEARAALRSRFDPLQCLRCKTDNFLVRMWPDASLVPGIADSASNRIVELICENCGFQEKHVVKLLSKGHDGNTNE